MVQIVNNGNNTKRKNCQLIPGIWYPHYSNRLIGPDSTPPSPDWSESTLSLPLISPVIKGFLRVSCAGLFKKFLMSCIFLILETTAFTCGWVIPSLDNSRIITPDLHGLAPPGCLIGISVH